MTEDVRAEAIAVPYTALQPATARAVIEEFVTRDPTDYGERERALEENVEDVMRPLRSGEAKGGIRPGDGHGEHRGGARTMTISFPVCGSGPCSLSR